MLLYDSALSLWEKSMKKTFWNNAAEKVDTNALHK